ncbi:MAG: helix-turn-helix transcriptional regulator [Deltaproteobacteria bacterium]|nr:helix-turn-helix transcriptional regulator [Deltaproteobacteria bacterium]
MDSRAARIKWILSERGWSQRELSRRAGFHTDSHLGNVLRNLTRDDDAAGLGTMRQIAAGAGVSERWLITGEGSPDDNQALPGDDVEPALPRSGATPATFGEFTNYLQTEKLARALDPMVPEQIWLAVRETSPLWLGRNAPTAQVLVDVARLLMKHAPR